MGKSGIWGRDPISVQLANADAGRAQEKPSMNEGKEMRLQQLREQIARGEYNVEPDVVAEAIIQRLRQQASTVEDERLDQNECSYPESVLPWPKSWKSTPDGPLTTRPIQVTDRIAALVESVSVPVRRALAGMQTQSS